MQGAGDDPPLGFQLQAASSQPVQPGLLEDSPGGGSEGQRQDSQVVGSRTTVSFFCCWFFVVVVLFCCFIFETVSLSSPGCPLPPKDWD